MKESRSSLCSSRDKAPSSMFRKETPSPVRLLDLLEKAGYRLDLCPFGLDRTVTGITDNSRKVLPGNLFTAISGNLADGHRFLSDAASRGAAALIVEKDIPPYPDTPLIRVPDTREALARLAHAWFGHPAQDKIVCGITGTNGKTTTAHLLRSCLAAAGLETALLGTIGHDLGTRTIAALNTTPSSLELASMFHEMTRAGIRAVAMEVSSHAIHQKRVLGIDFAVGIFCNLTRDHLDYHGTMENYREVKWSFFRDHVLANPGGVGVFNIDDEAGRDFAGRFPGKKITFSLESKADVFPREVNLDPEGIRVTLDLAGEERQVKTSLAGRFNVMNILAAAAGALGAGISVDHIVKGLSNAAAAPGRFERVDRGQSFHVIVDYAHTPDALERLLESVREFHPPRIITVFGCGGDRDCKKRFIMGEAVARSMLYCREDFAIITSDNPRGESPEEIARMAEEGLLAVLDSTERRRVVLDRREAIRNAISMASEGDFVLITGKGHEDYQKIGNRTIHFDDRETAREILEELGYVGQVEPGRDS